jgi:hypothetical protein
MKKLIIYSSIFLTACATRHAPDTSHWFVDCYNKQRHEALLAKAEAQLSADDINGRRNLRKKFWDLQKECK